MASEAIDTVLLTAHHIRVRVHPDDHALVSAGAGEALAARGARLVADAGLSRGGCRVESDLGQVDARIETRWAQAAATLGQDAAVGRRGRRIVSRRVPAGSRSQRWQRYLADLQAFAASRCRSRSQGTLVRVAGLVLEAAGIRVPVGSVCEVAWPQRPPVLAEVVGFSGDRAYLMPTGDVHGLASGARVVPRPSPVVPPRLGADSHPWRRREDRGCTCRSATACSAASSIRTASRWTARARSPTCTTSR